MPIRGLCALLRAVVCAAALLPAAAAAGGSEPVLRAGRAGGESYRLAVELAQTLAVAPKAPLALKVAASGGAAANAADAAAHGGLLFVSMPRAIRQALHGEMAMPTPDPTGGIRALFPLPFRTMHWVVRADSGVTRLADLAGRRFDVGRKGSLGEAETAAALELVRLRQPMRAIAGEGDPPATAIREAIGFAEAAAFPEPRLAALALGTPLRLLSLPHEELRRMLTADGELVAMMIPGATYRGIDSDTATVAMPVGVYATRDVSAAEAYRLTRAFWQSKPALELRDPRWAAVTAEAMAALGAKPHEGALRYYTAAGVRSAPLWR